MRIQMKYGVYPRSRLASNPKEVRRLSRGAVEIAGRGLAVRELQRRHKLQEEFEKHLDTIMEAVHAAWPRL
jgi:hypothetical protein